MTFLKKIIIIKILFNVEKIFIFLIKNALIRKKKK